MIAAPTPPVDVLFLTNNFPESTDDGQYDLDIGLLQDTTDRPAIKLAIAGRRHDGWYNLGKIHVQR